MRMTHGRRGRWWENENKGLGCVENVSIKWTVEKAPRSYYYFG
jgi:hypothetical protein